MPLKCGSGDACWVLNGLLDVLISPSKSIGFHQGFVDCANVDLLTCSATSHSDNSLERMIIQRSVGGQSSRSHLPIRWTDLIKSCTGCSFNDCIRTAEYGKITLPTSLSNVKTCSWVWPLRQECTNKKKKSILYLLYLFIFVSVCSLFLFSLVLYIIWIINN